MKFERSLKSASGQTFISSDARGENTVEPHHDLLQLNIRSAEPIELWHSQVFCRRPLLVMELAATSRDGASPVRPARGCPESPRSRGKSRPCPRINTTQGTAWPSTLYKVSDAPADRGRRPTERNKHRSIAGGDSSGRPGKGGRAPHSLSFRIALRGRFDSPTRL